MSARATGTQPMSERAQGKQPMNQRRTTQECNRRAAGKRPLDEQQMRPQQQQVKRAHAHANTHIEFVATSAHALTHHDGGRSTHEDDATTVPAGTGHVPTQVDGSHGAHADSSEAAAAGQSARVDGDEHSAVDANNSSAQASTSALTILLQTVMSTRTRAQVSKRDRQPQASESDDTR